MGFSQLNKVFESHVRMAIMGLLIVHEQLDFNTLRAELNLTDGNLASHAAALERAAYIQVQKGFVGRKTKTLYSATPEGRAAFVTHLNALQQLISNTPKST